MTSSVTQPDSEYRTGSTGGTKDRRVERQEDDENWIYKRQIVTWSFFLFTTGMVSVQLQHKSIKPSGKYLVLPDKFFAKGRGHRLEEEIWRHMECNIRTENFTWQKTNNCVGLKTIFLFKWINNDTMFRKRNSSVVEKTSSMQFTGHISTFRSADRGPELPQHWPFAVVLPSVLTSSYEPVQDTVGKTTRFNIWSFPWGISATLFWDYSHI